MGNVKMHVFQGKPILCSSRLGGGGGGVGPTNAIVSRVLLILEHYNWCQIKAETDVFYPVVIFANHLVCIFMNSNENLKN